jgi:prophage regulatory protein
MDIRPPSLLPKDQEQRILRLPAVLQTTGLSRSTMYRLMAEREFPAPVKLAKRAVGWRHADVWQWTMNRPQASR